MRSRTQKPKHTHTRTHTRCLFQRSLPSGRTEDTRKRSTETSNIYKSEARRKLTRAELGGDGHALALTYSPPFACVSREVLSRDRQTNVRGGGEREESQRPRRGAHSLAITSHTHTHKLIQRALNQPPSCMRIYVLRQQWCIASRRACTGVGSC